MDTLYALKAKVKYRRQSINRNIWLQVVTNEGTSEFSQLLTIRTMTDETDLGKFEDQVKGKLYFPDIQQMIFAFLRCSKWPERRSKEEVGLLCFQSFVRC